MWSGAGGSVHFCEKPLPIQPASISPGKQACGKRSFVAGPPDTGFFAHGSERFTAISIGQWGRIISERTELEAELTMREEADDDCLTPEEGQESSFVRA